VNATEISLALLGNAIGANMFTLAMPGRAGRVPLSRDAIRRAIELNGEAVSMNLDAFEWGRRAAARPDEVKELVSRSKAPTASSDLSETLDEMIERRVAFLTDYQKRGLCKALPQACRARPAKRSQGGARARRR
jgi:indolepyruvate ferredoxin oxidoreductase